MNEMGRQTSVNGAHLDSSTFQAMGLLFQWLIHLVDWLAITA